MWKRILMLLLVVALPALAMGEKIPSGWTRLGKVEGLLGDDWYKKTTANTVSFARLGDLVYVDQVVKGLETSFAVNRQFLGFAPATPLEFYFFSMVEPAHIQPKFEARLRTSTRARGVALGGTRMCVVNLGSQRQAEPFPPWEVAETCRHEMNHLFAFQLKGSDRLRSWGWLYEALAETVENTVKPPATQMNSSSMKAFLRGYKAVDASWQAMVNERNADDQESYRDYEKLLVSIVFFLQDKYGRDTIAKLMANCRGKDLEDAFVATYGKGAVGLEAEWKAHYGIK